ncbi:hypothetical protein NL676_014331 [Syzygium grande]|nr:hypothetical protein NL676_014331 [Syzygium grande]
MTETIAPARGYWSAGRQAASPPVGWRYTPRKVTIPAIKASARPPSPGRGVDPAGRVSPDSEPANLCSWCCLTADLPRSWEGTK